MKKFINKVKTMFCIAKLVLSTNKAEGFVDTGVKILMSVVLGALVLMGLYTLFGDTILPSIELKITDLFNYAG